MQIQHFVRTSLVVLLFAFALTFSVVYVVPLITHAQEGLPAGSSVSLTLDPLFPEPGSAVTVALDAYSIDTSGATITWYVDGAEVPSFRNARSIILTVGAIGDTTNVSAVVKSPSLPEFTVRKTIAPSAVDLIVEASTYVPAFYKGRALPSGESPAHIVAIPHIAGVTDPSSLTYRWEYSGSVLLGGPIRGKQSVDVIVSKYTGGYVIVTVMNGKGESVARKSIRLEAMEPELHFYEENPLRGLSERAIVNSFILVGDETLIHGEPYFMNTKLTDGGTNFEWTINGNPAQNQADPHTITLQRTGGAGHASIGLRAITTTRIPQYVQGNFTISF